MDKLLSLVTVVILSLTNLSSQTQLPFTKGVNLTGWFQVDNAKSIAFKSYTKKDFDNIKSLGADVIRLPINLHSMTSGNPDYIVDPLFFNYLDEVIHWAEELDLYLIIDNHTFDPQVDTSPEIEKPLVKIWPQLASRYKNKSQKLVYEILNEPHGITSVTWNNIQQKVIDGIRNLNDNHYIIVGGVDYNSISKLNEIKNFSDKKLIYTFHFYDPFLMTHQGATWISPSMINLKNMPYPYEASRMPGVPNDLKNTWVEQAYNGYKNDAVSQKIGETLNVASAFGMQRNVPVFCGELGVYIPNSLQEDRVRWYRDIRTKLDEKKIGWTSWDYHGGFGLFTEQDGLFEHHLNVEVVNALGFTAPPQSPYVLLPDDKGFPIYTDYPENGILTGGYGSQREYFDSEKAKGSYGFSWTNPGLYTNASFDFAPNKDLTLLKDQNFAIDFFIKSSIPNLEFDVRFLDTKKDQDDRPWRNRIKIDKSIAAWDGKWHHVHLPLKNFTEHGAWDNGWYNPEGKFDWKAVDRLEFATEYAPLNGTVFFDNIIVTDEDTAMLTDIPNIVLEKSDIIVLENPSQGMIYLRCDSRSPIVAIFDINGRLVERIKMEKEEKAKSKFLQRGVYFVKDEDRKVFIAKVMVE